MDSLERLLTYSDAQTHERGDATRTFGTDVPDDGAGRLAQGERLHDPAAEGVPADGREPRTGTGDCGAGAVSGVRSGICLSAWRRRAIGGERAVEVFAAYFHVVFVLPACMALMSLRSRADTRTECCGLGLRYLRYSVCQLMLSCCCLGIRTELLKGCLRANNRFWLVHPRLTCHFICRSLPDESP